MTYKGVTGINTSSDSSEDIEFAGYEGGEPVLAPVTGEVLRYGTVNRKNIITGTDEEVGFIKIRALGSTEAKAGATKCSHFGSSDDKKGLNYFWKINDNVVYLEGFDVSQILGEEVGKANSQANRNALKKYIDESEDNNYKTLYRVPNLLDDEREEELKAEEQSKTDAVYTFEEEYTESNKTKKRLYIKEGAVIGYTYSEDSPSDGMEEKKIEVLDKSEDSEDPEDPEDGKETDPEIPTKTKKFMLGNYMRIIFRDIEDEIIDNVEDYIEIPDGGSSINANVNDEKFLYWLGVYLEGGKVEKQGSKYVSPAQDANDSWGKQTHTFGLTPAENDLAKELGYNNIDWHQTLDLDMMIDIYLALIDEQREYVKKELGEDISDQYLQAFISIKHNYGNLTNRGDEYKQNHSVSETTWTTYNGNNAEGLRKRRKSEWLLVTEGRYTKAYDNPEEDLEFFSETPFTDWCSEHGVTINSST